MANNSAKKNEQSTRILRTVLQWGVFGLIGWMLAWNTVYLLGETITIWHFVLCCVVCAATFFCQKQVLKCWQLQLPVEAAEYYYDFLAMNGLVHLLDPFTHLVWHVYWLIVMFLVYHGGKWLWDYITPKYEPVDEEQEGDEKGGKKEKKEKPKVKYIKK